MGRAHAISGVAASTSMMAFGMPALGVESPGAGIAVLSVTIVAGWSLAPDIDHHRSAATTAFGLLSGGVHRVVALTGEWLTAATGTTWDMPRIHRGATHTVTFCAAVTVAVAASAVFLPVAAGAGVLGVAVGALSRLRVPSAVSALAGSATAALTAWTGGLPLSAGALGTLCGAGCLVHLFGDLITVEGVPLMAPIVAVRGKRWWMVRLPFGWGMRTGGRMETGVVAVLLMVAAVSTLKLLITK